MLLCVGIFLAVCVVVVQELAMRIIKTRPGLDINKMEGDFQKHLHVVWR
jgi:hypothetical protein